jgi:tetratricopeptide (TPR) repeat protein
MRAPPVSLPLQVGPLLLGLLLLAAPLAGCSSDLPSAQDKVEDAKARADYYEQAAKTYYDGGKYESAVQMWEKTLENKPGDQWARFGLAKSLQMIGTPQALRRAEGILVKILPLDWQHPTRGDVRFEVQTALATVYSDLADLYDRDMRVLEDRMGEPNRPDARDVQANYEVQKSKRNELLRKSLPLYEQVLARSRENPYALAGLAKGNLMAGNDEAGLHYAERYLALSQSSQVEWRKKLREWETMMQGSVTPEQRAFYVAKIQGAREKEKGMHLLLGAVHMRREEFDRAVTEYGAVIELDPATPAAYVERAQAYAALGRYSLAVGDLEQYLKMTDPEKQRRSRVNAAELLDRYRRIQGDQPYLRRTTETRPAAQPPGPPPPAPYLPPGAATGSPDR